VDAYVFGVGFMILCDYTAIAGNTVNDVAHGLFLSLPGSYQLSESANTFTGTIASRVFYLLILILLGEQLPQLFLLNPFGTGTARYQLGLSVYG